MTVPSHIAVDWGSSNLRAFLLGADGTLIARRSSDDGVLQPGRKEFSSTLSEVCAPWLDAYGPLPVIMSGMIGSRNGWVETGYVPCPAAAHTLAPALTTVPDQRSLTRIVPGVCGTNLFGSPDVMRGEEVQICGALEQLGIQDGIVCLPGTHSKWCAVYSGLIQSVTTFITGEMFALMRQHSSIGALITDDAFDPESFNAGLDATQSSAGLLNMFFSVRAGVLLKTLQCRSHASYLSGMLIGNEINAVLGAITNPGNIILVGSETLSQRYTAALGAQGIKTTSVDADQAFLKGIMLITQHQANA